MLKKERPALRQPLTARGVRALPGADTGRAKPIRKRVSVRRGWRESELEQLCLNLSRGLKIDLATE